MIFPAVPWCKSPTNGDPTSPECSLAAEFPEKGLVLL
jgi:hypothetical protein